MKLVVEGAVMLRRVALTHFGCHVVCDAELQVWDDALHAVVRLLARRSQVLLHGACHWCKDGLRGFAGVHHLARVLGRHGRLVLLESPDVCERFLYGHHQPNSAKHKGHGYVFSETIIRCYVRPHNLKATDGETPLTWPCVCGSGAPSPTPRSNTRYGSCLVCARLPRSSLGIGRLSYWCCSLRKRERAETNTG